MESIGVFINVLPSESNVGYSDKDPSRVGQGEQEVDFPRGDGGQSRRSTENICDAH